LTTILKDLKERLSAKNWLKGIILYLKPNLDENELNRISKSLAKMVRQIGIIGILIIMVISKLAKSLIKYSLCPEEYSPNLIFGIIDVTVDIIAFLTLIFITFWFFEPKFRKIIKVRRSFKN